MAASLRVATVDDLGHVLALWRAAGAEPSHTDDLASLERLLVHDADSLIVAEADGGTIVGSVIAGWNGWRSNHAAETETYTHTFQAAPTVLSGRAQK